MNDFAIHKLSGKYMALKGNKILKAIMDDTTPGVDLFVREVLQNCYDAYVKDAKYVAVNFEIGNFNKSDFVKCVPDSATPLKNTKEETCEFISIADSNTTGLTGVSYDDPNIKDNRLFKLVYDFMNGKDDENMGGAWGIGKSVYYRFGNGMVFYYTRTLENDQYCEKLAGCIIEDQNKCPSLLGSGSNGIAFFGKKEGEGDDLRYYPSFDSNFIEQFLGLFGLERYSGDKTGTLVIIPFVDESTLIGKKEYECDVPWKDDLKDSLEIAIQRWYFPKLWNTNPEAGRQLCVSINGIPVTCNKFFSCLQSLYNGEKIGATKNLISQNIVKHKVTDSGEEIGVIRSCLFTPEDLDVCCAPNHNPSPYAYLDIETQEDKGNENVTFYLRGTGMVVTYSGTKDFGFFPQKDKYLISVFVLNDNAIMASYDFPTRLGAYFRLVEKANHKEWSDLTEVPSAERPFKTIKKQVKSFLENNYVEKEVEVEVDPTEGNKLRGMLAAWLLPPNDFGKGPTGGEPKDPPATPPEPKPTKRNPVRVSYLNRDNLYSYHEIRAKIPPEKVLEIALKASAGGKSYTMDDWEKMGFKKPCSIAFLTFDSYKYGDKGSESKFTKYRYSGAGAFSKQITIVGMKESIGCFLFPAGCAEMTDKLKFKNLTKETITIKLRVGLKAIETLYSFGFVSKIGDK